MPKITELIEDSAIASATAMLTVDRGNTGRRLSWASEQEWAAARLAQEWFEASDFSSHPARAEFERALELVEVYEEKMICFRGRPHASNSPFILPTDFGPPPTNVATLGRYNAAGVPVLYLATSVDGVRLEVTNSAADLAGASVQSFEIDGTKLRIANFVASTLSPIIAESFDISERTGLGVGYEKTSLLAELVGSRFGGMIVPGVRGSREVRYSNIIIFQPGERWRDWLTLSQPERIF